LRGVVDAENLDVRDPALHHPLRVQCPYRRARRVGSDVELDRGRAYVLAIKTERRSEEINPPLDPVTVVEEHHPSERRVVVERWNP